MEWMRSRRSDMDTADQNVDMLVSRSSECRRKLERSRCNIRQFRRRLVLALVFARKDFERMSWEVDFFFPIGLVCSYVKKRCLTSVSK